MKKKFLSLIAILLIAVLLICAVPFSVNAEEIPQPTVCIEKFNLVFEDNVYLKYAVRFDGVDDSKINSSNIGMLYFTEPQSDYTAGGEVHSSKVVGYTMISGQKYYTFEYRHITAKQMTDDIYSIAYIEIDGQKYYSEPVKYSVLHYAYIKLGKIGVASENEDFRNLLSLTLEQGAAAQQYFEYNTDRLANAEYYLVEVVGGTLEDGFASGLYHSGETATMIAPVLAGELIFNGWQNSDGEPVKNELTFALDNIFANVVYTASYMEYSKGLAYTSNGDGTCSVRVGACTDTAIVIPSFSPTGDRVTSIGSFSGALTSVQIPDSVTSIHAGAFRGCSSLAGIVIPKSVTRIGAGAFSGCSALKSIEMKSKYGWELSSGTTIPGNYLSNPKDAVSWFTYYYVNYAWIRS